GVFAGAQKLVHDTQAHLHITNDSAKLRSITTLKNRYGASGNQIRFDLSNNGFKVIPGKAIWEMDLSSKADEAAMGDTLLLLKKNTIAGKTARWALRQAGNSAKSAVVKSIKDLFKGKKKKR